MDAGTLREGEGRSFVGGMHIPEYKSLTNDVPIRRMAIPDRVIVPLMQHSGAPCEPLVQVGATVQLGQKIGDSEEFISAPVHATLSGTVVAIERRTHPAGEAVECVVIEGKGEQGEFVPVAKNNPDQMSPEELKDAIKEAGLVGMGGAAFPTYVNINTRQPVDTLILNGAECEPFLTCDHRLMVERADELITGADILMRCIGAKKTFIGIESNKLDAIRILSSKTKAREDMEVVPLAVKYPQGYKSYLIKTITGRDVPRGARSAALGCIVRNVGTTFAVYEAVVHGKPFIERIITVSGPEVPNRGNYIVRLGTPADFILREAGVDPNQLAGNKVIFGGPMTGLAQSDLNVPVVKNTTGVLVLPSELVREQVPYTACVRCGVCVERCPNWLYPHQLSILSEYGMYEEMQQWDIWDCIECGVCAYVCPSQRPIVHFVKRAKTVIDNMS